MMSAQTGRLAVTLLAVLIACAANATAQRFESTGVKGIYAGLGLGTGSTHSGYHEDFNDDERSTGLSSTLNFGFIIQRDVLLGIETSSFRFETLGEDWTLTAVAIVATYYPHKSFFLKGGPAVVSIDYRYRTRAESFEYNTISDYGAGLLLAVGADIGLSRRYSFLPTIRFVIADFEEFSANAIGLNFEFARFW